jgi:hypothetical protein
MATIAPTKESTASERRLRARARKLGYRTLLRNLDGSYTLRVWLNDVAVFYNATLTEIENFLAAGRLEAEQTNE